MNLRKKIPVEIKDGMTRPPKVPKSPFWRRIWTWHLWLGLATVAPLLYWMGTALVFILWPIQTVRGVATSTGLAAPAPAPQRWTLPPQGTLEGAQSVLLQQVEGHPVAVVDRGAAAEIWDLEGHRSLGPVLPVAWAREAARRDFSGAYDEEGVYLFPRSGPGRRMGGNGPETLPSPAEYTGPRPVYAFHLRPGATHLYVDALGGQLRARRTGIWRIYDLAFRLHSFEFVGDGVKRVNMAVALALWMTLGSTGVLMAMKKLRKRG